MKCRVFSTSAAPRISAKSWFRHDGARSDQPRLISYPGKCSLFISGQSMRGVDVLGCFVLKSIVSRWANRVTSFNLIFPPHSTLITILSKACVPHTFMHCTSCLTGRRAVLDHTREWRQPAYPGFTWLIHQVHIATLYRDLCLFVSFRLLS